MLYWSKYVMKEAQRDPARSGAGSEVPKFFLRLQGHQQLTSIEQLGLDYGIPDLEATVVKYFRQNDSVFYDFSSSSTDYLMFFEPFSSLQLTLSVCHGLIKFASPRRIFAKKTSFRSVKLFGTEFLCLTIRFAPIWPAGEYSGMCNSRVIYVYLADLRADIRIFGPNIRTSGRRAG